jgi:hypothetical protein
MTTEPGEAADPVAAALSTIVRGLGELAQVHPWQVPDDRLGRTLADLDHVARLAEAQARCSAASTTGTCTGSTSRGASSTVRWSGTPAGRPRAGSIPALVPRVQLAPSTTSCVGG